MLLNLFLQLLCVLSIILVGFVGLFEVEVDHRTDKGIETAIKEINANRNIEGRGDRVTPFP